MSSPKSYSAFLDGVRIANGSLPAVTASLRADGRDPRLALVFDDETGEFGVATAAWPVDIRLYGHALAQSAFRHA